jgi:hypothetical protein
LYSRKFDVTILQFVIPVAVEGPMRVLQCGLLLMVLARLALAADSVITPEPGTAVLLAVGIAGLGFAAWRRRKK